MTRSAPPPAPTGPTRAATRPARGWLRWLPLLLVFAGMLVLLYPVGATQFNNYKQREFAASYQREVAHASNDDLQGDLERARAYNARLRGVPILDPWLQRKPSTDPGSTAYQEYLHQLDRFAIMARVRVPSVGIDLPIYHGTTDDVLARGVGHLYGTALPVGGVNSHTVLTSHTGLANATLFDRLTDVKQGDLMFIVVGTDTLAYRVDQIKVIVPTALEDLTATPGQDYLTLFTCTPYAVNTHRLLVRGVRVPIDPELAPAPAPVSAVDVLRVDGWLWVLLVAAVLGALALAVLAVRDRRRARARRSRVVGDGGRRGVRR